MEAVLFSTVYLLPCFLYIFAGVFIIIINTTKKNGKVGTVSKPLRDLVPIVFLMALCFMSGLPYLLYGQSAGFSTIADQIVIKLYIAASLIPCVLIRRYAGKDVCGQCSYIPIALVLLLMIIVDVAFYSGYGERVARILFRCSVILVFSVFCYVLYVSKAFGSETMSDGNRLGRELQMHLAILTLNTFMVLGYSFKLNALFDYLVVVAGFAVIHSVILILLVKGRTLSSLLKPENDGDEEDSPMSDESRQDLLEDTNISLRERIINYFEYEKPYLSKDLNMQEVAMRLFTNKTYLSKTINMEMKKNFRELVNYFRVREAIKIFAADTSLSMAELRDRSGFSNNASFTSAFKFNTGCTPGEWCRDMKNKMTYEEDRRKKDD